MRRADTENSISGRINRSTRFLTVVLVVPAVISLVMMLFYSAWYQSSISRMETVASLKPMVIDRIPEEVWDTVVGLKSYGACVDLLVNYYYDTAKDS